MIPFWVGILIGVLCLIAGAAIAFIIPFVRANMAKNTAKKVIRDAEIKAEHITKNAQIDGKQAVNELKQEANREIHERKQELQQQEKSLQQREQSIDRRDAALLAKENALDEKNETLSRRLKEMDRESKVSKEIAAFVKQKEEEAKEECDEKAKELLGFAVSRYAQDVTTERTVSVVALPSDEMKGRIIGREGRNIRSLEQLLGVDLIIDDTPEVITVSCFNPIRREVARLTLEALIKDGRIQPGRIEEIVEKCKKEVDESIHKAGQEVAFKLGLPRINKELLDYVGRLKYRTSYGQNALDHSVEVAYLTGIMAAELGLDQNLAKRAGLLHDVGKAADFEMDGSHVEIGSRLAKKYGEGDVVINSIESHHGDVPAKYVIANLVQAADTLSAARPGARSEILENYIKRIEQLEEICKSYDGVYQSYAMQSGRELRVMVIPEKIDDVGAFKLARDIKERIENEMTYPGQIKVSVIREYRAIETAK